MSKSEFFGELQKTRINEVVVYLKKSGHVYAIAKPCPEHPQSVGSGLPVPQNAVVESISTSAGLPPARKGEEASSWGIHQYIMGNTITEWDNLGFRVRCPDREYGPIKEKMMSIRMHMIILSLVVGHALSTET